MKTILVTFWFFCTIPFSFSQIVKMTKNVVSKYELEEGKIISIDSLADSAIEITIDYLNKTFTTVESEKGTRKKFSYSITSHYPRNSGIFFNLESNGSNVCAARITYDRSQFILCTQTEEQRFIADKYQGNSVIINELNIIYKAVYEPEFENNEAYLFNFALLEGEWLKVGDRDTMAIEFVFSTDSYDLPSYCNDSIKAGISGKQLYNVKGFGVKNRSFYICIGTGSYVLLTLKEGCIAEEYFIRSLTETEVVLFTGLGVERLIKK